MTDDPVNIDELEDPLLEAEESEEEIPAPVVTEDQIKAHPEYVRMQTELEAAKRAPAPQVQAPAPVDTTDPYAAEIERIAELQFSDPASAIRAQIALAGRVQQDIERQRYEFDAERRKDSTRQELIKSVANGDPELERYAADELRDLNALQLQAVRNDPKQQRFLELAAKGRKYEDAQAAPARTSGPSTPAPGGTPRSAQSGGGLSEIERMLFETAMDKDLRMTEQEARAWAKERAKQKRYSQEVRN